MLDDPTHRGIVSGAMRDNEQEQRLAALERRVGGGSVMSQTEEQREAEIERRAQERISAAVEGIPEALSRAVEQGLRRVLADEAVRKDFWAAGYRELEQHAGSNVAQWVGRRVVNIIVAAAFAAVLAWAVLWERGR